MKKALRETQTQPKIFAPPQTLYPSSSWSSSVPRSGNTASYTFSQHSRLRFILCVHTTRNFIRLFEQVAQFYTYTKWKFN